jgi:cyclase
LRDAGDPVEAASAYDEAGADELCFLDITASHENRDTIFDVVERTAERCFMPLTVGGVRTGATSASCSRPVQTVSINTAAVDGPDFIGPATPGSQCVVVAVDARVVAMSRRATHRRDRRGRRPTVALRSPSTPVGRSSRTAGVAPPASTP